MRKSILIALVFLSLLAAPLFGDGYYYCVTDYVEFGGMLIPVSETCYYYTTITPPPPPPPPPFYPPGSPPRQPPPPGGGSPPPNPPVVWIDSISDANPHQPKLAVHYNDSVVGLILDIPGRPSTAIAPPEREFLLPSLDNMTASQTELTVTAYDISNNKATAAAHVQRSSGTLRASDEILIQYWNQDPSTREIDLHIANYFRGVAADIYYAEYDVATVGDRNGRVQHIWAEDGLFWDNRNLAPGARPTPYPSVLGQRYVIIPSYRPQEMSYYGTECTPSGRTRLMFPTYSFPESAGRCEQPAEFSVAWASSGTFTIDRLDPGNVPYLPLDPIWVIGQHSLSVQP